MSAPRTMTVAEFVDQVGQACAELPEQQHRQVMAALQAHLAQHAADDDPAHRLGDPLEYVRELQQALDQPTRPPHRRRTRRIVSLSVVALLVLAATVTVLLRSHEAGGGRAAAVSRPPGVVPTGLVEGTITLGGQLTSTQTGTALVCLIPQDATNARICEATAGMYRLPPLPGVYDLTATFQPRPSGPNVSSTDPSYSKSTPCSPGSSLLTIAVGSDTHIDFDCPAT